MTGGVATAFHLTRCATACSRHITLLPVGLRCPAACTRHHFYRYCASCPAPVAVKSLAHSGECVWVGMEDGRIHVLRLGDGSTVKTLRGAHAGPVLTLARVADQVGSDEERTP